MLYIRRYLSTGVNLGDKISRSWKDEATAIMEGGANLMVRFVIEKINEKLHKANPILKLAAIAERERLADIFAPYVMAIGVVVYSPAAFNASNISKVLKAVGAKPNPIILRIAAGLDFKIYLEYAHMLYFLKSIHMACTTELLLSLADAVGIPKNKEVAEAVISKDQIEAIPVLSDIRFAKLGETLLSSISGIVGLIARIHIFEMERTYEAEEFERLLDKGLMAYLYAGDILSENGKDITKENISGILRAVKIEPDEETLRYVMQMDYTVLKFAYAPAIYLLKTLKKEEDPKSIIAILSSVGISSSQEIAAYILTIYNEYFASINK